MKEQLFENTYNVAVNRINWETGSNGLYRYSNIGQYTVYHDSTWGYYVTLNNSVIHYPVDLGKILDPEQ